MSHADDASPSGPIASHHATVEPVWIDYNGHLNVAYYILLFDRALDDALEQLGLGPDYRQAQGCSVFVGEHHVIYDREVLAGSSVAIGSRILTVDERRLVVFQEMRLGQEMGMGAPVRDATGEGEERPVATCETLCVHVDMAARRAVAWPPANRERRTRGCAGTTERPARAGRAIRLAHRGE